MLIKKWDVNTYSSFIYNCHTLETTQIAFNCEWIIEWKYINQYNGIIVLGNKKKQTTHICSSVDESQMHIAKRKNTHRTLWFHFHDTLKKAKNRDRKQVKGCQKLGVGMSWLPWIGEFWGVLKLFHILIMVMATWLCVINRTARTIHWKREILLYVNYTSINLIFKKAEDIF